MTTPAPADGSPDWHPDATPPEAGAGLDPGPVAELPFVADDATRSAIAAAGRTEDVKFSPDDRRIAIAGFKRDEFLLVDIDLDFSRGRRRIRLGHLTVVASPDLRQPHGLTFLDSETLVVANRQGTVHVFKVPPRGSKVGRLTVRAETTGGEAAFLKVASPGSVAAMAVGPRRYDLLVCNNSADQVTRHRLVAGAKPRVRRNDVLLEAGLDLPDGVAVSPSGRWIAVSNHNTGSVLLYRNKGVLGRRSRPVGTLCGAGFPHGVRFTADSQFVLVADAGRPFVHVYLGIGDDWHGTREPAMSWRVMSQAAYLLGHTNPQEGGPKGIDIDGGANVLATTCEQVPLAFFDVRAMLGAVQRRAPRPAGPSARQPAP